MSANILAKYLREEQKFQLASDLSEDFGNEQSVLGLVEVLDLLDTKSIESVCGKLLAYSKEFILSNGDLDKFEQHLSLLGKLPSTSAILLNWIYSSITSTLSERLNYLFSVSSIKIFNSNNIKFSKDSNVEIDLEYCLTVLEKMFALETIDIPQELDVLVLVLLTIKEESISMKASKALRWRSSSFLTNETLIWELVFDLLQSSTNYHVSLGFIQWLRFLINLNELLIETETFNSLVQSDQYWKYIQNGLISATHEQKKYSLSILKLSIQLTQIDLDNNLVSFKMSESKENVEQWKRFCTLYEIVGVDTALNQAEAAKSDILQMLSPNSYIKPSWSMALLSTGFKANMESVRKFAMGLMYAVPKENLSVFAHELLTTVFLKYAIEASHFQVKKTDDKFVCPYGEQLEEFVKNVLWSVKKDTVIFVTLVGELLALLVDSRSIFAPARIFLTSGIVKGLKSQKILTNTHLLQLYKLFNSTAEDESFEIYLQSLHLSFLKHLKPNKIPLLLDALTQFVLFNGYSILFDNIEPFLDYVATYHNKELNPIHFASKGPESQVVHFVLFKEYDPNSELFLRELANSGYDGIESSELVSSYSKLLTELISNPKESMYAKCSSLVNLEIFQNSWSTVNLTPLFESIKEDGVESFDFEKLEFFEKVYEKYAEVIYNDDNKFKLSFEDLSDLFKTLNSTDVGFKVKDSIIGSFLNIVLNFLKLSPLDETQLHELVSILKQSLRSAFYFTFIKISETFQYLFSNYELTIDLIAAIDILESIWDFITGERLVLNQKDMHLAFIKTVFHATLLKDTINNEYNGKVLKKIGLEIVASSFTRRSFLPCLSMCLLQYSLGYKSEFEQTEWITELVYKILTLIQDDSNLFKIKNLICSKFVNEVSFEKEFYEKIYGKEEISAKINIISIIVSCSNTFADDYFKQLVKDDPFRLISPKKRIDSGEELQRIYGYASLLLVSKKLSPQTLSQYVSEAFLDALEVESSPLVRSYIEWIIAIDMIQSETNRETLLKLFQDHHKPTLVTSVERIAFLVCQKLNNDESSVEFFENFTKYLIPNCASNKPLIRHFSNSLCLSLYPEIKSKKIELAIEPVLLKLYEDAKKSESTGKFRSGDALTWDVEKDFTLTSIFGGVLKRISPRDISVAISEEEFKKYIYSDELEISIGIFKSPWNSTEEQEKSNDSNNTNSLLQTKSGAWETVLDLDEQQRVVKRTELIVVSSLVDKPPNLGGICRLCDVLGTGLMTVDDMRVTKHPQFKNVAVTADYWMPMTEVKIANIVPFMKEKKKQGYTLIGLEQTDKSIVLGPQTKFPTKSLFLLGREAEGIPGDLLSELDYCIEIRQRGVIRSMNIQTATAVLVHAYSSSVE